MSIVYRVIVLEIDLNFIVFNLLFDLIEGFVSIFLNLVNFILNI